MSAIAINTSPTAELMTALLENVEPESKSGLLLVVLLVKGGLAVVASADPSGITGQVRPAKSPPVKHFKVTKVL